MKTNFQTLRVQSHRDTEFSPITFGSEYFSAAIHFVESNDSFRHTKPTSKTVEKMKTFANPIWWLLFVYLAFFNLNMSAQMQFPYEVTNTIRTHEICMGDLNDDGLDDIVGAAGEGISWSQHMPDGTFLPPQYLFYYGGGYSAAYMSLEVADFNADGLTDILYVKPESYGTNYFQSIYLARNEGNLIFSNPEIVIPECNQLVPVAYDLNQDGYTDIVSGTETNLEIYFNNNGENFTLSQQLPTINQYTYGILVQDLDEDGIVDISFTDNNYNDYRFFKGLGDGVFADGITLMETGSLTFADINGDNHLDVLYSINTGDQWTTIWSLVVRLWVSNFSYGPEIIVETPFGDTSDISYTIIDWNADGVKDVMIQTHTAPYPGPYHISFLEWNGTNSLTEIFSIEEFIDYYPMLYVIETDEDNYPEIFLSEITNMWHYIDVSDNSASLVSLHDDSLGPAHTEIPVDLDQDGDKDIVTLCAFNGRLGWYENIGTGFSSFQLINEEESWFNNVILFAEDMDSDLDIDLAAYRAEMSSYYIENNNGVFSSDVVYFDLSDAWYMQFGAAIDLNSDIYKDWVFLDQTGSLIPSICSANDPFGVHGSSMATSLISIIVDDMDGDGDKDIICKNLDGNQIHQFINNGNDFTTWEETVSDISNSISDIWQLIDYNNDGWLDIITDNGEGTNYRILYNSVNGIYDDIEYNGFIPYFQNPVADLDGDGLKDLILLINWSPIFYRNQGDGTFLPIGNLVNYYAYDTVEFADFTGDGVPEMMGSTQDEIYVNANFIGVFPQPVSGNVFNDINANGIKDPEDDYLPNFEIEIISNNNTAYYVGQSYFLLTGETGHFEISPNYNASIWELTTDSSQYIFDITATGDVPAYPLDFGFHAIGDNPSAIVNTVASQWSCATETFQTSTFIHNNGNSYLSGVVYVEFNDELLDIISTFSTPDSIVANRIYWTVENLLPGATSTYDVLFTNPGVQYMGEDIVFTTHFDRIIVVSEIPYTTSNIIDWEIACAYDPNDKTVFPAGFDTEGYITADNELTYTIRFQNTGTAPATNVTIYDLLSPFVDQNSFEMLSSSHTCVSTRSEDGLVTFHFNEIMLPDSASDLSGSNGYVTYRINVPANISPGTEIQNTANIVFDNNPAIITNTVQNTIYTCEWLYSDLPIFYYDGELRVTSGAVSYNWYYNNEIIPNEHTPQLQPDLVGYYHAEIEFENGCIVTTASFMYEIFGVTTDEFNNVATYPNPTSGTFQVSIAQSGCEMQLYDLTGKLILKEKLNSGLNTLEIGDRSPGMYQVMILSNGNVVSKSKIVLSH